MKYYRMKLQDALDAQSAVQSAQVKAGQPITQYQMSTTGGDASVWTPDPEGEARLTVVLIALGIRYEATDFQQIDW